MINNILIIRTKVIFNGQVDYGIIRDVDMKITDTEKVAKRIHRILPNILSKFDLGVPEGASFTYDVTVTDNFTLIKISNNGAELYEIELSLINLNQIVKPKIITLN